MPAHELLGVPASATVAEIKAAYRKRVRAYHPDCVDPFLKGHGEEVVKLLNRAYELMLRRSQ
jgi:molecular chaperone DnaJ